MSVSYGVLSTYPPTQCGLATFSNALVDSLRSPEDLVSVVSVVDAADLAPHPDVRHQWVRGAAGGAAAAAFALNDFDVAIIQHEYGIFGGRDGVDVLDVVRRLWVPSIVVLHTVLVTPTPRQRAILEELARLSVAVVTMTHTARQRLIEHYAVDPGLVRVIPHGALDNRPGQLAETRLSAVFPDRRPTGDPRSADPRLADPRLADPRLADPRLADPRRADPRRLPARAPVILTWGLLGEGKGIEWAIEAMALLGDVSPEPRYCVVGETHPKVLERHGERYRNGLMARAERLGIAHRVEFDSRYLGRVELNRLVRQADVILLPYDSTEQVTSGVLIEAIAAGRPVVSTGFPHAHELLSSGAGLVVERQDPAAIARALRRVLGEPGLAAAMAAEANRIAPALLWPAVAEQYREMAADALRPDVELATA